MKQKPINEIEDAAVEKALATISVLQGNTENQLVFSLLGREVARNVTQALRKEGYFVAKSETPPAIDLVDFFSNGKSTAKANPTAKVDPTAKANPTSKVEPLIDLIDLLSDAFDKPTASRMEAAMKMKAIMETIFNKGNKPDA